MIYLDNAATTQLDPAVLEAMLPYFMEQYGNPGSIHKMGTDALDAVEKARKNVADFLHTTPEHIIFTSGGSEGNSLVFSGLEEHLKQLNKLHIAVSAIEHDSVLQAVAHLTKRGFYSSFISPESDGEVAVLSVENSLHANTGLVSVMHTNNELGTSNKIEEICSLCHERGILVHSDCVQAAGFHDIDVEKLGVDFATISAHKFHGPKGIGAMYARDMSLLTPIVHGSSSQEFGLRGGTQNVPSIVGMGMACLIASGNISTWRNRCTKLRTCFVDELFADKDRSAGISVNGVSRMDVPSKVLNLKVDGVSGESLVIFLGGENICISAGSACSEHESNPSHVLRAIGMSPDDARRCIRVSFSEQNTLMEVREAVEVLLSSIELLRMINE